MSIVSITFDEGRKSQFEYAFPILKKVGMRATMYWLTGYRGKPWKAQNIATNIISEQEALCLHQEGWEISSHSNSHGNMVFASAQRATAECVVSKKVLGKLGIFESGLAYPGGHTSESNYQIAKKYFSYGREAINVAWQKFEAIDLDDGLKIDKFRLVGNAINENCVRRLDLETIFKQYKKGKKWLILTFHEIGGKLISKDDGILLSQFKEIIRLISKNGYEVKTVLEVVRDYNLHGNRNKEKEFFTKEKYAEEFFGKRWLVYPLSICYRFLFLEKLVNFVLRTKMLNPHYFFIERKNQKNGTKETIKYYDKYYSGKNDDYLIPEWRKSYLERMFEWLKIDNDLKKNKGKRFLDIGGGVGVTAIECAKRNLFSHVVDLSPVAIQNAKILANQQLSAKQRKLFHFQVATAERLPFPSNYFDKICSIAVLEYVKNDQRAIDEIQRVLKPGGKVFILTSNEKPSIFYFVEKWTERKSAKKLRYYKATDLIEEFEKRGFVLEDLAFHGHWPKVVQFFLQKIIPTSGKIGYKIWWFLEKQDIKLKNNPLSFSFSIAMVKKMKK